MLHLLLACTGAPEDTAVDTAQLNLKLSNTATAGSLVASDGSTHDVKLAPGLVIVHDAAFVLFTEGQAIARSGLEPFGEDGDPTTLLAELEGDTSVSAVGWLTARDATSYEAAPMFPGEYATATVTVSPGDHVTVAAMFGESNDTVVAALSVPAYDGDPLSGSLALALYDLGTEVDQEPGLGADQAPRQSAPNTGTAESAPVTRVEGVDGEYIWPAVETFATLASTPS